MKNWTPNEVADYIDSEVQKLPGNRTKTPTTLLFTYPDGGTQAFIRMLDSIDRDRYDLPLEDAGEFAMAVEMLREKKISAALQNRKQSNSTSQLPMDVLRELLDKFRDGRVDSRWPEIDCLKPDEQLWHQLNNDLNEAHSSLIAKNWKAATVVSASVMEALLFWWVNRQPSVIESGRKFGDFTALLNEAKSLKLFESDSEDPKDKKKPENNFETACSAKDYRNLIHADVAQRVNERCDRASSWKVFGITLGIAQAVGRKTP